LSDIPIWNKDNEYVKSGYRINYKSSFEIAWSFFQIHNETVNIWSHFLGKVIFLTIGIMIYFYFPDMEKQGSQGMVEYYNLKSGHLSMLEFTNERI
jgi:adiponectin receptor